MTTEEEWTFIEHKKVLQSNAPVGDRNVVVMDEAVGSMEDTSSVNASVYFSVLEENVHLLQGEQLDCKCPKFATVVEINNKLNGTLYLTNYQFIFKARSVSSLESASREEQAVLEEMKVPLGLIEKIEPALDNTAQVYTKHFQMFTFCFTSAVLQQQFIKRTNELISGLARHREAFAFFYQEEFKKDGWKMYSPEEEFFQRQKLPPTEWRLTNANQKFQVCKSYPRQFVVPSSIRDPGTGAFVVTNEYPRQLTSIVLARAALFRTSGRIPAVCWYNPRNKATICRSSQPMVGIMGNRNEEDEQLIKAIWAANPNKTPLYIIDCRPWSSAVANRAKGAGVESVENYQNAKLCFMNIDNIHVMRDSLKLLYDLLKGGPRTEHRWLSSLDSTRWLEHLRLVISGAVKIAKLVEIDRSSVLVHCSDGWDRTAQLSSLAQLLLDPYYRTLKGFQVLIEKEWITFGHKFNDRCGHSKSMFQDAECSPVFLQFIDCVWQITNQFQCAFEFNEHFLITLIDHVFSCRFGTFLCNSEFERVKEKLVENTKSLWSYIHSKQPQFINPIYKEHCGALFPVCSVHQIQLWSGYYLRFHNKTAQIKYDETCRENLRTALATRNTKLEQEIAQLRKLLESQNQRNFQLETELRNAQKEKEQLKKAVNCTIYRVEGDKEAEVIAQIRPMSSDGTDSDLVSRFCEDLKSLHIIEDYGETPILFQASRSASPSPSLMYSASPISSPSPTSALAVSATNDTPNAPQQSGNNVCLGDSSSSSTGGTRSSSPLTAINSPTASPGPVIIADYTVENQNVGTQRSQSNEDDFVILEKCLKAHQPQDNDPQPALPLNQQDDVIITLEITESSTGSAPSSIRFPVRFADYLTIVTRYCRLGLSLPFLNHHHHHHQVATN